MTVLTVLLFSVTTATAFARGSAGKGHFGGRHFSGAQAQFGSHRHVGPRVGISHRHVGPRVGIGFMLAAPAFWLYPPPPYYPPVAVAPSAPPVYIEQGSAPSASDRPEGYWYYCAEAQAYYPYVKECAGTWQPVAPEAPQGQ